MMNLSTPWGQNKPTFGYGLSRDPINNGLAFCTLMNEGSGSRLIDLVKKNNGTLASTGARARGKFGPALKMNGSSDSVAFAQVPLTVTDNWCISSWINPAALSLLGIAVSQGADNGVVGDGYAFGIGNGAGSAGSKLQGLLPGIAWVDSGYTFPSAGLWYFCVMQREAGTIRFYVNAVRTSGSSATNPATPTVFNLGSQTGIRFFNGGIDVVRLYSRYLRQHEISRLFNEPFAGITPRRGRIVSTSAAPPPPGGFFGRRYYDSLIGGCNV